MYAKYDKYESVSVMKSYTFNTISYSESEKTTIYKGQKINDLLIDILNRYPQFSKKLELDIDVSDNIDLLPNHIKHLQINVFKIIKQQNIFPINLKSLVFGYNLSKDVYDDVIQ